MKKFVFREDRLPSENGCSEIVNVNELRQQDNFFPNKLIIASYIARHFFFVWFLVENKDCRFGEY